MWWTSDREFHKTVRFVATVQKDPSRKEEKNKKFPSTRRFKFARRFKAFYLKRSKCLWHILRWSHSVWCDSLLEPSEGGVISGAPRSARRKTCSRMKRLVCHSAVEISSYWKNMLWEFVFGFFGWKAYKFVRKCNYKLLFSDVKSLLTLSFLTSPSPDTTIPLSMITAEFKAPPPLSRWRSVWLRLFEQRFLLSNVLAGSLCRCHVASRTIPASHFWLSDKWCLP